MNICLLPRESRLVLVVYGRTFDSENQDASTTISQTELGWASIQFFNVDGLVYINFFNSTQRCNCSTCFREFSQGKHLLSLWPSCADKRLGPAPAPGTHPYSHSHPVLSMYSNLNNYSLGETGFSKS